MKFLKGLTLILNSELLGVLVALSILTGIIWLVHRLVTRRAQEASLQPKEVDMDEMFISQCQEKDKGTRVDQIKRVV